MLEARKLEYGAHIDVTSYKNFQRRTHNGDGVADANLVWKQHTEGGCSIRLLRPQEHVDGLWHLLAGLEHFWGSFAGCNTYLTPAGTQGFAPHFDDIEAFIVQLEGAKRWRVYAPRDTDETLPRFSSNNFTQVRVSGALCCCSAWLATPPVVSDGTWLVFADGDRVASARHSCPRWRLAVFPPWLDSPRRV